MSLTRRKTLALIGGGLVVATGATAGTFAATRTPTKALAPWNQAGDYEDPRLFALSYALLAPNPHNRQPWLVDMEKKDQFSLYRDETRDLPHTDPFHRQIFIGLGCFLELMSIAATLRNMSAEIDLFPEGPDGAVARVRMARGADPDRLAKHILTRRSCKEPFSDRPVEQNVAAPLNTYGRVVTDIAEVDRIRTLTREAWLTEMHTHRTLKESVDLMRFGKGEINANPDGIDLGGPFLESLMLAGVLTRENQLDPASTGFQAGIRIYREMLSATPAYIVLTTTGNTRHDQIDAGRRWLRLNLETTGLGLALHPVSQALQEFKEMEPHRQRAHELLANPGETVQMLGRLGYGPKTAPAPRWPLETRIMNE